MEEIQNDWDTAKTDGTVQTLHEYGYLSKWFMFLHMSEYFIYY